MMRNKRNLKQDSVDKDEFRNEFQITQEVLFPEDRNTKRQVPPQPQKPEQDDLIVTEVVED